MSLIYLCSFLAFFFFFLLPDLKATMTLWKLPISHHGPYLRKRNVRTGDSDKCPVEFPSLTKGHIPYRACVYGQLHNAHMGWASSSAEGARCIHIAHGSAPLPLLHLKHVASLYLQYTLAPASCAACGGLAMPSDPPRSPRSLAEFGGASVSTPVSAEPAPCRGGTGKGGGMN